MCEIIDRNWRENSGIHIQNNDLKKELSAILRQLCEPDINLRGHPQERQLNGNSFSLEKYVTKFDVLTYRARIGKYSK